MTASNSPILIAGGGIGGLSAAIALARRGFHVRGLERGPGATETGAGIQLGPNATRILQAWGLSETLDRHAFSPARIDIFDALNGRRLNAVPLGETIAEKHGAPYITMRRADLHRVLLDAARAAGVDLASSFDVTAVSQRVDDVVAFDSHGAHASGAALIGADGVRSAVRASLSPGATLREDGRIAWRAAMPRKPASGDAVSLWLNPKFHLVRYPVERGESENLVAVTAGNDAAAPDFSDWPHAIRDHIPGPSDWHPWPLYVLPELVSWSQGLVTLLGDAAHPITPFLASGAVLAIEDAEVLAEEVARTPHDLAAAFKRYEARRRPRTSDVAKRSRRMGEIYHMAGAMRLARNAVIAATPANQLLARNDWLYGFRVSAG